MEATENAGVSSSAAVVGASQGKKKSAICMKRKLEAIKFAEQTSVSAAAKKFGVHRRRIQEWKKSKAAIESAASGKGNKKRLSGGGRRQRYRQVNARVRDWVLEKRRLRQSVSRRLIRLQAKKIAKEFPECAGFAASLGWLEKLLRRNRFTLRATTTTCQRPPADSIDKIVKFVLFIRSQFKKYKYSASNVFACDETAVWLDPIGKKCIETRGARDVTVQTLGHEKVHITVMLCARANGTKCKPFVLLNRKRPVPAIVQKFAGRLVLAWAGKVWMDNELTEDFLRRVLGPLSFGQRLLVWDSFRCHLSKETKEVLSELKFHTAVVPGGCTKYVQAPDVSWNKPFKSAINRYHEDWMADGSGIELTRGGNPRPPPMETYLQWVVDAWDSLSNDVIRDSFNVCGITNKGDGSEDDLIHCFKPDGPIPEGLAVLKAEASSDVSPPEATPEATHDELDEVMMEIEVGGSEQSGSDSSESESASDEEFDMSDDGL